MSDETPKLPIGYEFIPENEWQKSIPKKELGWIYWHPSYQGWKDLDNPTTTLLKISAGDFKHFCRPITTEIPKGPMYFDPNQSPIEDPYFREFHGHKIDIYRVALLFGITHPAQFQALKKVMRAGRSHKTLEQDIAEAIESCERWKAMVEEDKTV